MLNKQNRIAMVRYILMCFAKNFAIETFARLATEFVYKYGNWLWQHMPESNVDQYTSICNIDNSC